MGTAELYGVIGFLGMAVLTLAGLWVRAHDQHRLWSTAKIADHEKVIAVLETEFSGVRGDVAEIKRMLEEHTAYDRRFQAALVAKLGLKFEE